MPEAAYAPVPFFFPITTTTAAARPATAYVTLSTGTALNTQPYMVNQTSASAVFPLMAYQLEYNTVSAEQLQQMADAQAEQHARFTQRQAQYQSARERARELLELLLSPDQASMRAEYGWFEVVGSAGGRYRIRDGIAGNVRLLDGDRETAALCAHPAGVPEADVHLAQLLALTDDEAAFRAVANATVLG